MRPRSFLLFFYLLIVSGVYSQNNSIGRIQRVVIDPGHGGKDPGAVSPDKRFLEKDITLSVSLRLGSMIKVKYPNIEVIYTRKSDIFIPLDERTAIANRNKADLFISIHVNSAKAKSASGTETFVMGMDKSSSNLEVCKLENSVIVLEGDYSSKYEGFDPNVPESYIIFSLLQNSHLEQSLILATSIQKQLSNGPIKQNRGIKQGALLVLWKTTMPSVLVELGFISNTNDNRILTNKDSHVDFAYNMFKAFEEYKAQYEKGTIIEEKATPATEPKKEIIEDKREEQNTDTIKKALRPGEENSKTETLNRDKAENKAEKSTDNQIITKEVNKNTSYKIQILAVTKKLPAKARDLKGLKQYDYIKVSGFYKYNTGNFTSLEEAREALNKVREKFPQAFIIKVIDGQIVPINR